MQHAPQIFEVKSDILGNKPEKNAQNPGATDSWL